MMDGLEMFERTLAAEREERERLERREAEKKDRRRHHHHHHHHHRDRDNGRDRSRSPKRDDGHRSRHRHRHSRREDDDKHHRHRDKRPRHEGREDSSDEERIHRKRRHRDESDGENTSEDDAGKSKTADSKKPGLTRDAWMESPSALGLEFKQKKVVEERKPRPQEPQRIVSKRELNRGLVDAELAVPAANYEFGDEGSSWRMTKLAAVYRTAQQTGRPIDEVAIERYGSLREFDEAREEREELDKRKLYGNGYAGKRKPTGELYRERAGVGSLEAGKDVDRQDSSASDEGSEAEADSQPGSPAASGPALDSTALNRLRARLMKAKLRKLPEAAELEAEYNAALAGSGPSTSAAAIPLGPVERLLVGQRAEVKPVETKRGRERGLLEENQDMSVEDMVREERRTRGLRSGDIRGLADRIAMDGGFENDLEYMDENAEKLAKRVHKSEASLRNMAANEFQRLNAILDKCPLCNYEERGTPGRGPIAPVVSCATRVYLTLPTEPELSPGGAVIVPATHHTNLLECDEDEWEEIRNFMKSLTRLYHDQGRDVIFYENAAAPRRHLHAAMVAVPIPYDLGATAPAFFREAMLSSDTEWSQHRKIIDTGKAAREGLGRAAFRRSIAKEMPYFHVWFTLDGGLGHVVEDEARWPKGDLFAREILGGMMDVEPQIIKRQGRWRRGEGEDKRVEAFRKAWRRFDWTRVLEEESK